MSTSAGATPTADRRELTLLDLGTVLVRHWRLILGLPFSLAVIAALLSFLITPQFTASTTFVPEASSGARLPAGLAGVAGIAGQLGLSVGTEASRSPRFYSDVLKSRELMERVLRSYYPFRPARSEALDSTRLLDVLKVHGRDAADSLANGVRLLQGLVTTQVDNQTAMVRLGVTAPDPDLAAAVANRFIQYLNDFNTLKRQSQARERRKFVELRISEAQNELRAAEEEMRGFLERNRSWQQAPQLVFEEGRLRRQLDIRQEVYVTLRRDYETARIEEVNDTPVITVVDPAVPPSKRSKPRRSVITSLAFVLGAIFGVFGAFAIEYLDYARREEDDRYRNFTEVLRRARQDLFRIVPKGHSRGPGA